jgi:transforming growth factor-beta-induced protein
MKRVFLKFVAAAGIAALVSACGGSDDKDDIAKIATDTASLSSLVAAATKAGLVGELGRDDANLTVFAPTNAAFDTLAVALGFANGPAMVTALEPADLAKILSYHVLPAAEARLHSPPAAPPRPRSTPSVAAPPPWASAPPAACV